MRAQLHESLEKYLFFEGLFKLLAREGTDFLDKPDEDSFLPGPLHIDRSGNAKQAGRILPALDHDGDGVRYFLPREVQNLFAQNLGSQEPLGLIGEMAGGIKRGAFRQA